MPAWTNQEILHIALRQSAVDAGCKPEDFLRGENVVVTSRADPGARKYLELPFAAHLVSYGSNIVASTADQCRELVSSYINRFPPEHCFETPNMHVLNDGLERFGLRVCHMAEYFLPDVDSLRVLDGPLPTRLLGRGDFGPLYVSEWSNALCEKRRELDILGVGAYDGERLAGLAACSADCGDMWQIGVDVLPAGTGPGLDKPSGPGDSGTGKGPVLLRRLVQHQIGPKRHPKRLPTRLGGDDRKGRGGCREDEQRQMTGGPAGWDGFFPSLQAAFSVVH